MVNVSNAFREELFNDRRNYLEYVDITLKDKTVLNLTNKDLWGGGMTIEDAVSKDNSFDVGAAIINKCKVVINNIYDDFSKYDFGDANVIVWAGLNLPNGTIERIRKGTYTVNEAAYNGSIITLQCFDHMQKFDRPYTDSKLTYPATLNQIIRDACSVCGVVLQTYNFPHDTFVVQTRPDDEAVTFREIISWCAQIACCFCRCDTLGRLELKWYNQKILEETALDGGDFGIYDLGDKVDGGDFRTWNHENIISGGEFGDRRGMHLIYSVYSLDIATDDVVITGVRVLEKNREENQEAITTYQSGTDGYVVSIENNQLIKGGAGQTVAQWVGERLIGFRFRKANITHSSDPTIEAGDVGYLVDRKGNMYRIVMSSTKFSIGNSQNTVSSAQNPARNSAARFSAETKNYVEFRKDIEKERSDREKALGELKERVDNSSGLFTTEITQPDGSTVFYMHDKPTLDESVIVWKMTAEAFAVSTDGGKTYNAGLTVDGDLIARILSVTGFYFDWAKGGTLTLGGNENQYGKLIIKDERNWDIGRFDKDGVSVRSIAKFITTVDGVAGYNFSKSVFKPNGLEFRNGKTKQSGDLTDHYIGEIESFYGYEAGNATEKKKIISLFSQGEDGVSSLEVRDDSGKYTARVRAQKDFVTIKPEIVTDGIGGSHGYGNSRSGIRFGISDTAIGYFEDITKSSLWEKMKNGLYVQKDTLGGSQVPNAYNVCVKGSFASSGEKARIAETENYGKRSLYCYEMPSPMFGDIGEGITDENGECFIAIGDIFGETVNADMEYQVFLQKEGNGDIWVEKKTKTYFQVIGTKKLKFSWEIKVKQKGYEYERLEKFDSSLGEKRTDYESEFLKEAKELKAKKEGEIYETA